MIGKYFSLGEYNMLYVESETNESFITWRAMREFVDQPALHTRHSFEINEFHTMISNGEITEIDPPTFYIITKRDTFSVKEEIKRAGGMWSMFEKFWYFNQKPDLEYTYKECLVFPFTGERLN